MENYPAYKPMDTATFDEKFARLRFRKRFVEHLGDLLRFLFQLLGLFALLTLATLVILWRFYPHVVAGWLPQLTNFGQAAVEPKEQSEQELEQQLEILEQKLVQLERQKRMWQETGEKLQLRTRELEEKNRRLEAENQRLRAMKRR
jgi:cell shape-determining protein MreC